MKTRNCLTESPAYHGAGREAGTPGEYRNISGNEATAWGLVTGARLAGLEIMLRLIPDHAGVAVSCTIWRVSSSSV